MTSSIEEFLAERVPRHATLPSALLEYAARERGLAVERFDASIMLVTCADTLVPFTDMNGPDTSRMGELMCGFQDGLRPFLAERGVPVAPSSVFLTAETKRGLKYAGELGWPVNVRPARLAGERGVTLGVSDADGFRTAWQAAVRAYGKASGYKRVLVERRVPGERLSCFVVGQDVVAVTRRAGDELIDETDDVAPELTSLAVRAVDAVPGLAYAEVTVIDAGGSAGARGGGAHEDDAYDEDDDAYAEDDDYAEGDDDELDQDDDAGTRAAGSRYVVDSIDSSAVPVAHAPTRGRPRDVAGAVLDWYLNTPRWPMPRILTHTPAGGEFSAVEPLFQGTR